MYNNSSVRLTELYETASENPYENSNQCFFLLADHLQYHQLIILTNKPALNGYK